MQYNKFSPDGILSPFVECYFTWHSSESVSDFVVESPPSGFCSMVFNLGDAYHLQNKKYDRLIVPKVFVSGQSVYSYKLFLNGRINIAGIVFKPAALATLFNLPVYQYTEERIPLSNVFSEARVNALLSELANAITPNDKSRILERFLLNHYSIRRPAPDAIDEAANLIVEKNGILDVSEITRNAFMSRRNFERKFFEKVGLSPKYYARIRRISYLMNLIAGKKKADWVQLFAECEFYDHSHFIKDFQAFTGRTPSQYLAENVELANFVSKPKQDRIQD
jgi:AraC-like DNA-binding protein